MINNDNVYALYYYMNSVEFLIRRDFMPLFNEALWNLSFFLHVIQVLWLTITDFDDLLLNIVHKKLRFE